MRKPAALFSECNKLPAERRIGAVVIFGADHRIVGILSETCSEDDTIRGLMGCMTAGKFRHMPVVQQGKLIGIVSIGDMVKSHVEEIDDEAEALRDYIQIA